MGLLFCMEEFALNKDEVSRNADLGIALFGDFMVKIQKDHQFPGPDWHTCYSVNDYFWLWPTYEVGLNVTSSQMSKGSIFQVGKAVVIKTKADNKPSSRSQPRKDLTMFHHFIFILLIRL